MKHLPAILLLTVTTAVADVPRHDETEMRMDVTHDFANLNFVDAAHLNGQRAKFLVRLDSDDDVYEKHVLYECVGRADGVERILWLLKGQEATEKMVVEAKLLALHHRAAVGKDGTRFPGFTEYRLMDAVRR